MFNLLAKVLVVLFGIGVIGSLVVVVLTFIEDLGDIGEDATTTPRKLSEPASRKSATPEVVAPKPAV